MKIDKNRFLLLTTALAATTTAVVLGATGCEINTTTANAGAGDSGSFPPIDASSSVLDATASDAADAADAGVCLGNTGAAPLCGPADEDADAAAFAQCSDECTFATQNFKTEVASAISKCLDRSLLDASAEGCIGSAESCVRESVGKACDDPEAASFCTTFLSGCNDAGAVPTQAQCVAVVRAMNAQGKTALSTCTEEGLTCNGCIDGVLLKL